MDDNDEEEKAKLEIRNETKNKLPAHFNCFHIRLTFGRARSLALRRPNRPYERFGFWFGRQRQCDACSNLFGRAKHKSRLQLYIFILLRRFLSLRSRVHMFALTETDFDEITATERRHAVDF